MKAFSPSEGIAKLSRDAMAGKAAEFEYYIQLLCDNNGVKHKGVKLEKRIELLGSKLNFSEFEIKQCTLGRHLRNAIDHNDPPKMYKLLHEAGYGPNDACFIQIDLRPQPSTTPQPTTYINNLLAGSRGWYELGTMALNDVVEMLQQHLK
jgi:hypothetical protein